MIPKIIHYVWVGPKPISENILKCIKSWQKIMPDYKIQLWNESNFEINSYTFTKKAYHKKKYAYVADYIRLWVLFQQGGIYLDTDMYVLKRLDDLLNYNLVLGKEDTEYISAGMIAANQNNLYIQKLLDYYNQHTEILEPIPKIMTRVFQEYSNRLNSNQNNIQINSIFDQLDQVNKMSQVDKIKILESKYFYPYNSDNIKIFLQNGWTGAPQESYAVHLWDYSWGHPLNKFIKKIGLHKNLKRITEKLGIKNQIKKILKME